MRTSVVVVAYGQRAVTAAFLDRWAQVAPADAELVLVDNASPDDTLELLDAWRDRATVLALPENRNFSGGCNAGAAAARGDALLFVNNDTLLEPGLVEALTDEVLVAGAAIAGPRLHHRDGTLQHAGIAMSAAAKDAVLPLHLFHRAPGDLGAARLVLELDCVTGACLAIPRARFTALGGFDEAYVNGLEDVDLCLRARMAGGRVVYRGDLAMLHDEGRTRGVVRGADENVRLFCATWGPLLAPDDELVARVWDAALTIPRGVAQAAVREPATVAVRGDAMGIGPWSAQTRAALAALEARGERPALTGGTPVVLVPRLAEGEWGLVARALGRVAGEDTPVVDAAEVAVPGEVLAAMGAAEPVRRVGGGGTLAVLPAHDLDRCVALMDAAGPGATLLPTAAPDALHALAEARGVRLTAPCSSLARLAAHVALHDAVLADDPLDPFDHVGAIARALGVPSAPGALKRPVALPTT